ncbi:MAG: ATP synthase F1 subunit delta [Bacteroidota bacterium]
MVEDRIGFRYAKSIFGLAEEKNMLEDTHTDMALIHQVSRENPQFVRMLKSPLVHGDAKQKIVDRVFADAFKAELTTLLVKMVIDKGREQYLPNVAKAFIDLYDRAKGIARGTLTSAAPLSDEEAKAIQQAVEKELGKTFKMDTEVNADLIGGFKLKIGDRLFDGSISSSLRRLRREISQ